MKDYHRATSNPTRFFLRLLLLLLLVAFGHSAHAKLNVSPTAINFGDVPTGTRGSATITLRATLGVSNIAFFTYGNGVFFQSNNCPKFLETGQTCSVTVDFEPTTPGNYTGEIQIPHRTGIDPVNVTTTVSLAGSGVEANWSTKPANSYSFPDTAVNLKVNQTITLINSGNGISHIDSVSASGDFTAFNSTCDNTLGANQTCDLAVRFAPSGQGTRNGTLTISGRGSDAKTPITTSLALTGIGLQTDPQLDKTSLNFPDVLAGSSSNPIPVTIINKGNGAFTINSISVPTGFTQRNNCGPTLASGANCTAQVVFAPEGGGLFEGALSVAGVDTDGTTPVSRSAAISGTGILSGNLVISPSAVSFPLTVIGNSSASQSVSIHNTGNGSITLQSISVSHGFTETNNCGTVLAEGSSCTVDVSFIPTSASTFNGTLSVSALDSDKTTPLSTSTQLTGTGFNNQTSNPNLTVYNTDIDFGNTPVNTDSQTETVIIANDNPLVEIIIREISTAGEFTQTNNCPTLLNYGDRCNVFVQYAPNTTGEMVGSLSIQTRYTIINQTFGQTPVDYGEIISLRGFGTFESLVVSPSAIDFGTIQTGSPNPSETITVTNEGNVELSIESISVSAPFSQTNDCGTTLAAGASCSVIITADSNQTLSDAVLTIETRSPGGTQTTSNQVAITGDTSSQPTNPDVDLNEIFSAFTANNPNLAALVEVILDTCPSGRASDRLQADCDAVVAAALESDPETANALAQILPERSIKSSRLMQQGGQTQSRNINSRIAALRGGATGMSAGGLTFQINNKSLTAEQLSSLFAANDTGGSAGNEGGLFDSRLGGFISGTIISGDKDGSEFDSGLEFKTSGITAGLDYRFTDNLVLGGAIGYMRTDTDLDNNGGNVDTKGINLSAYGTYYTDKGFFVDFSAGYGKNDFDQDRNIVFDLVSQGAVNQSATADYDGKMLNLSVSTGYDFTKNGWTFGPRANLDYIRADVDGFTETLSNPNGDGGGWATTIEKSKQDWLTLKLGAKASYALSTNWGVLSPYFGFDWLHEFKNDSQIIMGGLAEDPESMLFGIQTVEPDRNYFQVSVGASAVFKNGLIGFINYETILTNDNWDRQSVNLGMRAEF